MKPVKDIQKSTRETDLDRDGQSVISEGLEAEAPRLLRGLPDGHQVPRTLQVQRHALHQLGENPQNVKGEGSEKDLTPSKTVWMDVVTLQHSIRVTKLSPYVILYSWEMTKVQAEQSPNSKDNASICKPGPYFPIWGGSDCLIGTNMIVIVAVFIESDTVDSHNSCKWSIYKIPLFGHWESPMVRQHHSNNPEKEISPVMSQELSCCVSSVQSSNKVTVTTSCNLKDEKIKTPGGKQALVEKYWNYPLTMGMQKILLYSL